MNKKCCFTYCGNICTVFICLQLQIPFAGKFLRRLLRKTLLAFVIHHHMLHWDHIWPLKPLQWWKKCTIGFYLSSDVISMVSDRFNTLIMVFQTERDRSGVTMMSLSNVHLYVFLLSQCWVLMFILSSSISSVMWFFLWKDWLRIFPGCR